MKTIEFENVLDIGDLYSERVFLKLEDENILFVCKDNNDERYLCLCSEFRHMLKWVLCKITPENIVKLILKTIDIRSAFELSNNEIINITYKNGAWAHEKINFERIANSIIPKRDVYLQENIEIPMSYVDLLMSEDA